MQFFTHVKIVFSGIDPIICVQIYLSFMKPLFLKSYINLIIGAKIYLKFMKQNFLVLSL